MLTLTPSKPPPVVPEEPCLTKLSRGPRPGKRLSRRSEVRRCDESVYNIKKR